MSGGAQAWFERAQIGLRNVHIRAYVRVGTFLRALGLIYFIAFTSFGVQAPGLIGSRGILPLRDYLNAVRAAVGGAAYWNVPSVLWLNAGDDALAAVWIMGAACALAVVFGICQRPFLAVCLALWLSLCAVGQDFLSFQWDILLSEAGFLALFADDSPARVWLYRWLLFRLVFFSGAVKLLSGDPSWRNLTALHYQYWTQPLPTPLAWYMEQLPMSFQKVSTALVFVAELGAPFLFFGPRRVRHVGAWITIGLQTLILATGNYAFFNTLTILLAGFLFIEPQRRPEGVRHRAVSAGLAGFLGVVSGLLFLGLFGAPLPPGGAAILHAVEPLRIVNSYGLFAVMTTTRPEIVVEGSNDGVNWRAYEFKDKPGDVMRPPPVVEPHQPRLDWQMWFAALGNYQQSPWFVNFMIRLLQEPSVLRLLARNPFPKAPPKYVRARTYLYQFTHSGERAWWTREERGMYFPPVSLK